MNPLDIRKFITGFLILSAIASSSAILIGSSGSSDAQKPPKAETKKIESQAPVRAFVEQLPNPAKANGESGALEARAPSGNLTDDLSRTIAEQLANANPSGPERGLDGRVGAAAPSDTAILAALQSSLNDPQVLARVIRDIPEDDAPAQPSTVINAPSSADIAAYVNSLNAIIDGSAAQAEAPRIAQSDPFDVINAMDVMMGQRVAGIQKLSVPRPLLNFHLAALALFEKAQKMTGLARGASGADDPIKQLVLVQIYSNRVDEALLAYSDEAERAQAILEKTARVPGVRLSISKDSLISDLFGVKTARAANILEGTVGAVVGGAGFCWLSVKLAAKAAAAQVGAGAAGTVAGTVPSVPTSDRGLALIASSLGAVQAPTTVATAVTSFGDCLKKAATDALKNVIVHRIVQQTIRWIQGGGSPQFVRDWRQFLTDSADIVAGQAIEDIAPGLCKSFGPLLRFQLESTYRSNPQPITCTLEQVVSNVKNFYDDFSQGGWAAYGEAILPSGNYFGQLFEGSQIIELRRLAEREAAKANAESAQGFLSTKICIKYETENQCASRIYNDLGTTYEVAANYCKYKEGEKLANGRINSQGKRCLQEEITTPGQALGQLTYRALSAPLERIVNADDLAALISALVDSAFDQVTKLVDGKPNQKGLLGVTFASSTTPLDQCAKLSGNAQLKCIESIIIPVSTSTLPEDESGENGENCTPAPPQYGLPPGPDNPGCYCKGRDKEINKSLLGQSPYADLMAALYAAQLAVVEQARSGKDVGLYNKEGSTDYRWVRNPGIYKGAVVQELEKSGVIVAKRPIGDEIQMKRKADASGAGFQINSAINASGGWTRYNVGNAVCGPAEF